MEWIFLRTSCSREKGLQFIWKAQKAYKINSASILYSQDDANNDPQWSEEQLIAAKFCFAGLVIGQTEVDIMSHATQAIFEILEKSWLPQDCTLVDMKVQIKWRFESKDYNWEMSLVV